MASQGPTIRESVFYSTRRLICLQGKLTFVTEKSAYWSLSNGISRLATIVGGMLELGLEGHGLL